MFHGEQNRHSACLTLCRFCLPLFQKNTPEMKISSRFLVTAETKEDAIVACRRALRAAGRPVSAQ